MRNTFQRKALAVVGLALSMMVPASAQVAGNNPAFDITGFIQSATLNATDPTAASSVLAGGTITVNGITIVVPTNVIVQMPANTISYGELFMEAPSNLNGNDYRCKTGTGAPNSCANPAVLQTGLALNDTPKLPGTYEVHVQGNIVTSPATGGVPTYVAGLMFFSQQSINQGQGFITSIEYDSNNNSTGTMYVNGTPGVVGTGTKIVINDPAISGLTNPVFPARAGVGRYTLGQSPDIRFQVDQANPTIKAETGYPMCIPRIKPGTPAVDSSGNPILDANGNQYTDDPECPQKNRPRSAGSFVYNFTMDPPIDVLNSLGAAAPTNLQGTDAYKMMPFEVGDYITFMGTLEVDSLGAQYMSVHTISDNVGAYTFPGTDPAYVAIDVLLQGVGGIPNPAFPQEATTRTRVEGQTTDDSRPVDIYGLDIDCDGNEFERIPAWQARFTQDPGPPTGAVRGRFRFRPIGGTFLPPTRDVRVRLSDPGTNNPKNPSGINFTSGNDGMFNTIVGQDGVTRTTANGLYYDGYQAPNFEYIFPENLGIGNPIPEANFADFNWLVNGVGPWTSPFGSATSTPPGTVMTGQLTPWPGTPVALSCVPGVKPTGLQTTFVVTPTSPVVNNPITLNASADKKTGAFKFEWFIQTTVGGPFNPLPRTQCSVGDCSVATYTPTAVGTINIRLVVNRSATVPAGFFSATPTAVVVKATAPTVDVVTPTNVVYRIVKARLDVNATSSIIQATPASCSLTAPAPGCMIVTLDILNPSTNKPYVAAMQNLGNGTYTITFNGLPTPNVVTIVSGNGGSATTAVTRIR